MTTDPSEEKRIRRALVEAALTRATDIPADEVEQRLRDLSELHDLGMALKEVRFIHPQLPDRVQERPNTLEERPGSEAKRREPPREP